QFRLHPLLEGLRAGHDHAAAQLRVDLDVDHGGLRGAAGVDQVVDRGIDRVVGVRAFHLGAPIAGVDGLVAAGHVPPVVAAAGAGGDLVWAAAAGAGGAAVAAGAQVVAAAGVDVGPPADGLDGVVAGAAQDAVAADAGDDGISARAGVDHHVHGDVRRGLGD